MLNFNLEGMKLSILVIVILLFSSCGKNLNLDPQDTINDAQFWKTPTDFKLAANDLYNGLDRFGFEDQESDIAFSNSNPISNGSYQPAETSSRWNASYTYIRSSNVVIDKGAGFSDRQIMVYVAEARFFRAWYYWKIYRIYGGVPLIDKALEVNDPGLFAPRSSRQETVDFMLKDLEIAAAVLPQQKELQQADIGRITRGAAQALAARIALFEASWAKSRGMPGSARYFELAASSASAVMDANQYRLYDGHGVESYRYLFLEPGDDAPECILDRRYERSILGHDIPYQYDSDGYNPTKKLADMYLDKTGIPITHPSSVFKGYATFTSEFEERDPRMTMTIIVPGTLTNRVFHAINKVANWPDKPQRNFNTGYMLYKFMSEDPIANNGGQHADESLFDFDKHLIRYAEVLLIYAEAWFEMNGSISDAQLDRSINLLRKRANMPGLSNAFVASNNLSMRQEIRRERTVELALEGFRYDDLRRWKTAELELREDIKGIKIKNTEWQNRSPYNTYHFQSKTDHDGFLIVETQRNFDAIKHYLQPLPTREVAFYSSNGFSLVQNPGW